MSHHLYVTPGFILDSRNKGEANKLLSIFTRDLGLVFATAQGVRHLKSKLRFHTQLFSYGEFSLVRGKEMWRLTGAQEGDYIFSPILKNDKALMLVAARIFSLLKRLLHGEEVNQQLFSTITSGFTALATIKLTPDLLQAFEYIMVIKIVSILGYISDKSSGYLFVRAPLLNEELLMQAHLVRSKLVVEINNALKASHL